jgi:type VI secretion system secreted protein VgrG
MFAQRFRFSLESPHFAADRLHLVGFEGREAIGEFFSFTIDCVLPDKSGIDVGNILGSRLSVTATLDGLEVRRFHGMVVGVHDKLEPSAEYRTYRLQVAPSAHRMRLVNTQDIFQDISIPEIVRSKLQLVGLGAEDIEMRLRHEYAPREFVVQYRETDAAFISRLCEHLGISFFFEHDEKTDKIVFTDYEGGFRSIGYARFSPSGDQRDVYQLELHAKVVPATYVVYDYNYRIPQISITGAAELGCGAGGGFAEYAPHVKTPEEGLHLARVRSEEQQSVHQQLTGASDQPGFYAGSAIELSNHPHWSASPLLLTEVVHQATQPASERDGDASYRNTFRAVPSGFCYRPARATPRPRIQGLLTGVVEPGPGGSADLAHIDAEGRYTIRFLFDTAQTERQKASRPVRMAQPHAGPGHGMHFPLKPGIEVVMAFIDGDPDRPIIVGAVPNPLTPSPVVSGNSRENAIRTVSGARIRIIDG